MVVVNVKIMFGRSQRGGIKFHHLNLLSIEELPVLSKVDEGIAKDVFLPAELRSIWRVPLQSIWILGDK
jgi:hypothetical protein